ncbi:GreA/GreB family elongation factor [Parachryseolinea silvisoli]|uniref:GreA/GreB family elongation factor n=1 Tax=Parachryseolinea silvisoli TaxID=2873601 RepID=UPI00226599E4|nr:GreA/GreB family elongation factor [Parachryseolinea silvisoli]MCD9017851.1 GreA/GreB family elongation factor [Parachryseolinea silvisoli]
MSTHKQKLYALCRDHVQRRIQDISQALEEVKESANEETKSTAGDKYETARAMAQNEMEKLNAQLQENRKLQQVLEQIDPLRSAPIIQLGSAVRTTQGNFYIAVSAGALGEGKEAYFAISPASPIGTLLIGRKVGDEFQFNKKTYRIDSVE